MNGSLANLPEDPSTQYKRRPGCWIQTFTGKQFYILDPQPDDIEILDIAHSLSMTCRYNGHCLRFYSVAEHSVLLASYTQHVLQRGTRDVMRALLHDACEAYVGDLPKPIKRSMPGIEERENAVERVIMQKFGLEIAKPDWLDEIDHRIWFDEKTALMVPRNDWSFEGETQPLGVVIQSWDPHTAEGIFLNAFRQLEATLRNEITRPVAVYDDRCPLCGPAKKKMHTGKCK